MLLVEMLGRCRLRSRPVIRQFAGRVLRVIRDNTRRDKMIRCSDCAGVGAAVSPAPAPHVAPRIPGVSRLRAEQDKGLIRRHL